MLHQVSSAFYDCMRLSYGSQYLSVYKRLHPTTSVSVVYIRRKTNQMENQTTAAEKAKAYAELSKLKRKVSTLIADNAEQEAILKHIAEAGHDNKDSKRIYFEVKLGRVEERMKKLWTTIVVMTLAAIVASVIISLVPAGEGQGNRGFSYLIALVILPFLLLFVQLFLKTEKAGYVAKLKQLEDSSLSHKS